MIREHAAGYRTRVRDELTAAFAEEHTAHEIAASFAIGIFITTLPSLGLGIGLFFVLVYVWSWVSKTALFSSVVVLNPFVKPAVHAVSIGVGEFLLGPEPVEFFEMELLNWIFTIVKSLVMGNLVVACVLSTIAYVVVFQLTRTYRRYDVNLLDTLAD